MGVRMKGTVSLVFDRRIPVIRKKIGVDRYGEPIYQYRINKAKLNMKFQTILKREVIDMVDNTFSEDLDYTYVGDNDDC